MTMLIETEIIENVAAGLRAEGFSVVIGPVSPIIPTDLSLLRPDMAAFRADTKLIVEVVSRSSEKKHKLEQLTTVLATPSDWSLRVVSFDGEPTAALPLLTPEKARIFLEEARHLSGDHPQAAFLLAWASLEALARVTKSDQFAKPQTPGRIVEVLAQEGYFTPAEADLLRELSKRRNRLIHGDLDSKLTAEDVQRFLTIIEAGLLGEAA